jgi:hypothetical protein
VNYVDNLQNPATISSSSAQSRTTSAGAIFNYQPLINFGKCPSRQVSPKVLLDDDSSVFWEIWSHRHSLACGAYWSLATILVGFGAAG